MARKYTKSSEYWDQPRKQAEASTPQSITVNTTPQGPDITPLPFPDVAYGETQEARASSASLTTSYRNSQANNGLTDPTAFQNIRAIPMPYAGFSGNRDYVGAKDSIELCAKAWAGIAIARNAVEVSVEFSNQPMVIKCSNSTVKTFFEEWFNAINITKLNEQLFREYYRSGNPFIYKFSGKFGPSYYKNLQQSFGAKDNKIPIRYELLNPANIFVPTGLTYPHSYVRLLSTYELVRLKNPMTVQDEQVYQSLPKEVKQMIQAGNSFPLGVYIPLEADRLRFFFYKKQDYEPLSIPMLYPVLADIEYKLELKKMDKELARKIEHALLIVTTGESGTQYNGGNGINVKNIARLQNLFTNQTISRVLVADYTTKAQWAIPDIKDILGPEKYKVVDADIREGLQSILTGDDKFANAQIKAKIFIQRLEEGQNNLLVNFLMPEVQQVCDAMGFRTVPNISFRKINLQDEAVLMRIYTSLAQLGVLTADQAVKAIETDVLPDYDEMEEGQKAYKAQRDKGLFMPLIGGQKDGGASGSNGRPSGSGGEKQIGIRKSSPIGTTAKAAEGFSIKAYAQNLKASDRLVAEIQKKFKVSEPNDTQRSIIESLARAIMGTKPVEQWVKAIASAIKSPPLIPSETAQELEEISEQFEVDSWDAALLYHSKASMEGAPRYTPQAEKPKVMDEEMIRKVATAAAQTVVMETAKASVAPVVPATPINDKLTIQLDQPTRKPKKVKVVKTAQGFEFNETE
jgi:hypothetical protein